MFMHPFQWDLPQLLRHHTRKAVRSIGGGECSLLHSWKGWDSFPGAPVPPRVLRCGLPLHLSPQSSVGPGKASGYHSINSLFIGGLADNNLKN